MNNPELKNLLSPILNYFEMENKMRHSDNEELENLVKLEESINAEFDVCMDVIPKIKKLVNE